MTERVSPRGIPALSWRQVLIASAAAGLACLIWWEAPESLPRDEPQPAADATESALDTLRSVEALADEGPEGISQLIDLLGSPDPKSRQYALLTLRRLGPAAGGALDRIRERLVDDDVETREFAVDAYWQIRRDPCDVARVLVTTLADRSDRVRKAAARVLVQIGPPATAPVVELLSTPDPVARIAALRVLRRIGWDRSRTRLDGVLREVAADADANVRGAALLTLARWGDPSAAEIRELLALPVPSDLDRRGPEMEPGPAETALLAIIRLGPGAADNLPDLLKLVDQPAPPAEVQWYTVLGALRSMKSAARPAIPRLLQEFDNSPRSRRFGRLELAWTLFEIGAERGDVDARLIPLMSDSDANWREAAWLLARVSPEEARRQVTILIPQLAPDQIARHPAALPAIAGLAAVAGEAVPALRALLREPLDDNQMRQVLDALGEIGPEAAAAAPIVIEMLSRDSASADGSRRSALIGALSRMGDAARPAIPLLLSELKIPPAQSRTPRQFFTVRADTHRQTLAALAQIGGDDPAVLSALQTYLGNENDFVSATALGALLTLTPDSPEFLAALLQHRPGKGHFQDHWVLAITRMTCDRRDAVPPLVELLQGDSPDLRKVAAWVLGSLGPEAQAALPALHEALTEWENLFHPTRAFPFYSYQDFNELYFDGRRMAFQITLEERARRESSVRDLVREAILKIDSTADIPEIPCLAAATAN